MRGNELLDKMELVQPAYLEEADCPVKSTRRRPILWAAACLCFVISFHFLFFYHKDTEKPTGSVTVEDIEDLQTLSTLYDGTLLAEKLISSEAEFTTIQLTHDKDRSISDVSSWRNLYASVQYPNGTVIMNCMFPEEQEKPQFPTSPSESIQYGDVLVFLYPEEATLQFEYIYRVVFKYQGIFYDLTTHSNDPDHIHQVLDQILSTTLENTTPGTSTPNTQEQPPISDNPDFGIPMQPILDNPDSDAPTQPILDNSDSDTPTQPMPDSPDSDTQEELSTSGEPFSNILGFDSYRICVEETTPHFFIWHYYAQTGDETECIAEISEYLIQGQEPAAYCIDLDNDSITELICNCVYGTGVEGVVVFRNNNGIIERGTIRQKTLETEFGIELTHGSSSIQSRYDPSEESFVVTGPRDGNQITVSFQSLDYFYFSSYKH